MWHSPSEMFRHQICALRQMLQPYSFYSVEVGLFEKSSLKIHRFSTKSTDAWVLDKISNMKNNELKNINSKEWIDRINVLKTYHIVNSDCFKMIKNHPDVLQIPLKKFSNTVKQWSSVLGLNNFRTVLSKNPMYLEVEHHTIRKRLPHLISLCKSSDLVVKLLLNSPGVMFDDWNTVMEKVDYLLKVRGFNINSVVLSYGLSRSLDFIKFRFDILQKCGIYKQKTLHTHKINKYDQSQHQNPSLEDILQINDKFFSRAVAKISLEEYNVCYELFMEDNEEYTDSDDDSDESDDENDDES